MIHLSFYIQKGIENTMSLIYNIYYIGKDGSAKEFAKEMIESGIVEEIRAQEGNEKYEYFFPMDDEETVLLIDSWKDKEAIDNHHKSERMERIASLRKKYKLKMRVEAYVNSEGR